MAPPPGSTQPWPERPLTLLLLLLRGALVRVYRRPIRSMQSWSPQARS